VQLTATPDLDETDPDANRAGDIVYRQTPTGTALDQSGELMLVDPSTNITRSLGLSGREPVWSPDGAMIAFMSDIEGSWQVYIYDVDKGKVWLVSTDCPTQCGYPAWSPDGKQVLYQVSISADDPTSQGLWIAPVDGSRKPQRYLAGHYSHPTWSAKNGIAFEGTDGIYRATPGNHPKAERYLYQDPSAISFYSPAWSN